MIFFNHSKRTHDNTGGFTMSRKCDHDWFDHYMMYSMMNNTGNAGGGGNDWGCLMIILACILWIPAFGLFMLLMNAIGNGILGLFSYLVSLIGG
jgi:hypothetical protein